MCGMIVKLLTKDAEIITLRAIALKLATRPRYRCDLSDRDHNATSYSTETLVPEEVDSQRRAEIITLRAIALKPLENQCSVWFEYAEIITLRAIALKPAISRR